MTKRSPVVNRRRRSGASTRSGSLAAADRSTPAHAPAPADAATPTGATAASSEPDAPATGHAGRRTPPGFLSQVWHVAAKDLRIEWRSREMLATMTFFAVVVVLVFAVAFVAGEDRPGPGVTAGILWIALAFAGTVGLARTFDREREGEAMRALLLSPAPRGAVFLGKLLATAVIMLIVQAIIVPLASLLFSATVGAHPFRLITMLGLGTVGFCAAGSVFSAALVRSRGREVLLSVLLFPVAMPILIAGARGTSQLLDPALENLAGPDLWLRFLFALDVLFVVAGLWAFEPIVNDG